MTTRNEPLTPADEGRRSSDQLDLAPERCAHCDDTGDVTGRDGEWRGYCSCEAGQAFKAWGKPPCQQCGAMTEDEATSRCMGRAAGDGCHGTDLWPG